MIYSLKNVFKLLKEGLTNEISIWFYRLILILFIGFIGFSFCGIMGNIAIKTFIINNSKCFPDTTIEK